MFQSSGLFARVPCPFPRRSCKRPHCWYKHPEDGGRLFGYSSPSPSWCSLTTIDLTGDQDGIQSTSSTPQVVDYAESFQELEHINKKIETAKYEVEKEQRKLSCYRAAEGENTNGCWYICPNSIKAPTQSRKYVLDNSKPRTDLEYDPMSNFTAEFRSYKSSSLALKGKGVNQVDVKKPVSHHVAPYCSPSPEIQDDAYDDDVLIIDIPDSPNRKLAQAHCDLDAVVTPVQENARKKDRKASASSVVELTECVEDFNSKSPDHNSRCFQFTEVEPDHISDKDNETVCVEVPKCLEAKRQTAERQLSMKTEECQESICTLPNSHQEAAEASLGSSPLSIEIPSSPEESFSLKAATDAVIVINSSSDEDEEEMDVELSDSDPVAECYRIFMEANNKEDGGGDQEPPEMEPKHVEKPNQPDVPAIKPQELPAKRRIAHESKDAEVAGVKRRPQIQVLVPLQGPVKASPASQLVGGVPNIQQVQQKAVILTAALKGGQALLSSVGQRKPMPAPPSVPHPSTPPAVTVNTSPAHQQKVCAKYIRVGSAVLNVDNNLRLILPQGTLPPYSTSSEVTPVFTPITQVCLGPITRKTLSVPAQTYRSTASLLIPAAARRPSQSYSVVSVPTATSKTPSQAAMKPGAVKRKVKQQSETAKEKVPHDIRQRYVTEFTEAFLDTSADIDEAFKKALAEEKTVYNRSVNKLKYLSIAVNALKRLKKQNSVTSSDEKANGRNPKGNIPLNRKQLRGNDDASLYEILRDYILSEDQLIEGNYPVQHPEKPGCAVLFANNKKGGNDPLKRICCRCGATYSVNKAGKHTRTEECTYHYGKGVENRVPGGVETRYSCCQGVMGAPGCQIFKLHVHDSLAMDGFVSTIPRRPADGSCPGVYALDCEMCYTIHGLELSRVTVVDSSLRVVFDTFVKPHNEVIDYNTRFSGISEEDVKANHVSLAEVQKTLLSFISADTILIGHGLETDFCALKLLHGTVVDTAAVFPHRLGPPHRLSLSSLTAEHLTRIIQESVCGHDTAEDAAACMELMLLKDKDGKMKRNDGKNTLHPTPKCT
ncbi:RNA exonuclease 1 homolog isoform X2 [Hippocampus zosterae]|uniref:RNA exonuclease 1 homolog isoform X2 n=1 Tax=Hippocampus zosterae TaxID=109293 RepID=UPI00223D7F0C|nr:RNA exonuclease 1 homolog isoform X2 [Hippocampus zosterae]